MSWKYWGATLVAAITITIGLVGSSYGGSWQPDDVKVKILVPVVEIAPYHLFQDSKKFTEMEWPKSKLREDANETITSFDQLKGKTSRHYKLKPNEPIYKNDLSEEEANGHDIKIEVAHTLPLSPERYPVGFFRKGDRVDIEAIVQSATPGEGVKTSFVLEDIEVLDVGLQPNKKPSKEDKEKNFLSLRLTRAQSLVLKFYQETAKFDVVRRIPREHKQDDVLGLSENPKSSMMKAAATPEQKVLDNWLGSWRSNYKQPKTEGATEEKTGTAELTISRVVGGQFIRENSEHSDNTTGSVTSTYDTQKKSYRGWWFSSNGQTGESIGKWDADNKTMTWTSVGEPSPVTTVKQHFVDNDNIEWDVVTKDNSGKLLFRMEGKSVRIKATTAK